MGAELKIAVVIPCYRVKDHILEVVNGIGPEVSSIYVVDDACPDDSGEFVQRNSQDKRLRFIFHEENQGVGGAVISGYVAAIEEGADVIVKIDGDGQMEPERVQAFIKPIVDGRADYTKGNRFLNIDTIFEMPKIRIFGNALLSLFSKFSSGYWSVADPTNGYTAVRTTTLSQVRLDKISQSFFFESDMLFRLGLAGARVVDIEIPSRYQDEQSNLRISRVSLEFLAKHLRNFAKRIAYKYYLREWSLPTLEIPIVIVTGLLGTTVTIQNLYRYFEDGVSLPAGQATFIALNLIVSLQLALSVISYDIQSEPR